jgi:hypothetical protein
MTAEALKNLTLMEVHDFLKSKKWVDLTHAFAPGIPHWPGFPNEQREALYYYDEGVGTWGSGERTLIHPPIL